jgi:hypothetical protein
VHTAVAEVTGLAPDDVIITQDVTGGGFGGKEDFPSVLACQVAVAAYVTGKPVRVVLGRREDVESTSKRHPAFCYIKVAVKDRRVTGMMIEALYDAGAYTTMTPVVLQRGVIAGGGVYDIPNLKVHGEARKTNSVPSGAFRGFGGPQMFFAVEMMMSHIAKELGEDAMDFKLSHASKKGDVTSTGGKCHFDVPVPDMMNAVAAASDYRRKQEEYKEQTGRLRRGIAMSAVYHGAGFTGIGERDIIKAVVKLRKDSGAGHQKLYIPKMLPQIKKIDSVSYDKFKSRLEQFHPRLIMNMVDEPKNADVAMKIRRSCEEYLDLKIEHMGIIYRDVIQDTALASRLPIVLYKPQSILSQAIYRIADKILESPEDTYSPDDKQIEDSFQEAEMEAEADFESKMEYIEDLLHSGAMNQGDLIETVRSQQYEISKLKKENNFIKMKLTRAAQQGFKV